MLLRYSTVTPFSLNNIIFRYSQHNFHIWEFLKQTFLRVSRKQFTIKWKAAELLTDGSPGSWTDLLALWRLKFEDSNMVLRC